MEYAAIIAVGAYLLIRAKFLNAAIFAVLVAVALTLRWRGIGPFGDE